MPSFRGKPACVCLIEWLPVFEAELKRRGVIKQSIDIYQLIGGAVASGGTHATGGAFDIAQGDLTTISVARSMGADATWRRKYNWDGRGGMAHTHGVLRGCPHNGPARYQITSSNYGVDHGHNGLANGARDDGPRPLSGRTWQEGIAWAKAQQKAANMRTTDIEIYIQNCASDQTGWVGTRAPLIAKRVKFWRPHFVSAVELFDNKRSILSRRLLPTYALAGYNHGKVQYVRRNLRGWKNVGAAKKYDLGNGKHAIAKHWRHRNSKAEFVLVTQHLSWEHRAASQRRDEEKRLVAFLKRDFRGLPYLVTGDFNDALKATHSRPVDSSGNVLEAAGLHDLYKDVPQRWRTREQFNSANQGKTPPPKDGIHLDRACGSASFEGLAWTLDVLEGDGPGDHWGLRMKVRLTHPK